MEKCIIFDIGGVVVNFDPRGWLAERFPENLAQTLLEAVFKSPEWDDFDRGDIPFAKAAAVFQQRGEKLGLADEMRQVTDAAFDLLSTRESMAAMMETLHKNTVKMYFLSNMSPEVKSMLSRREFWKLFSGGLASSDVSLMKPDPAFYIVFLKRFGLLASDCLFFDDTPENVAAARALGIHGHLFTGDEGFRAVLAQQGMAPAVW